MGRSNIPASGRELTHHRHISRKTGTACTLSNMGMVAHLGGVPPCGYQHHTFICHRHALRVDTSIIPLYVTYIMWNIHVIKANQTIWRMIVRVRQKRPNLCGACASKTDERSLVRDGVGEQRRWGVVLREGTNKAIMHARQRDRKVRCRLKWVFSAPK